MRILYCLVGVMMVCGTDLVLAQPEDSNDASAVAQDAPTESPSNIARDHHLRGVEAQREGDLAAAEASFRASLEIQFRDSTANNLAVVLEEQGHFAEAIVLYDRLLSIPAEEVRIPRAQLQADRTRARARLATVRITIGGAPEAEVFVNGQALGTFRAGTTLAHSANPGLGVFEARYGERTHRSELQMQSGQEYNVSLEFALLWPARGPTREASGDASQSSMNPEPEEASETEGGRSTALYWILGAAAVVGGAIALGFALRPRPDTFDESVIESWNALRAR